eukprot:13567066-Heterocapsa_arctica.AAC.2
MANVYFVNRKIGGQIKSGGTVLLSIGKVNLVFCTSMTEGLKKIISLIVSGTLESSPQIGLLFPSQNIRWQKTLATVVKELLRKCTLMDLHTILELVTTQ